MKAPERVVLEYLWHIILEIAMPFPLQHVRVEKQDVACATDLHADLDDSKPLEEAI